METIFRLKLSELNVDLLNTLKSLFKKDKEIEIFLSVKSSKLKKQEAKEAYFKKLDTALKDVEKGNVISFSSAEFEELNRKLISKR